MKKNKDLATLLAKKHLSGEHAARFIIEDIQRISCGEEPLITDADSKALNEAVTGKSERAVVKSHLKTYIQLMTCIQDTELAGMTVQRHLYRIVFLFLLARETRNHDMELQTIPENELDGLRWSLMTWFGRLAVIEIVSEYLQVNFMEQLNVPKKEMEHAVALFNWASRYSDVFETSEENKLLPIDTAPLQPTASWRDEVAHSLRKGGDSEWLDIASNVRFVSKSQ